MSIIARISRLFRSDVHFILDSLEDPQAILTQAFRDMQERLEEEEHSFAQLKKSAENSKSRRKELEKKRVELQEQLELCIRNSNADLARAVIRTRLRTDKALEALVRQAESLDAQIKEKEEQIVKKRAQLKELKEKATVAQAAADLSQEASLAPWEEASSISESEVEVILLAEKERLSGSLHN